MRPRSYWQVVQDAQAVSLQVSIVAATVEVFLLLQRSAASIRAVLAVALGFVLAGQVLVRLLDGASICGCSCQPASYCQSILHKLAGPLRSGHAAHQACVHAQPGCGEHRQI